MIMNVMNTITIAFKEKEMAIDKTAKIKIHLKIAPPMINLILLLVLWGLIKFTDHCWVSKITKDVNTPTTTQNRKISKFMKPGLPFVDDVWLLLFAAFLIRYVYISCNIQWQHQQTIIRW